MYGDIKKNLLKMNPYIIDAFSAEIAKPDNLDNILIEHDYEIRPKSPYIVFQNNKYILTINNNKYEYDYVVLGIGSNGVSTSPIPSASIVPLAIQKGTSAPNFNPISINCS